MPLSMYGCLGNSCSYPSASSMSGISKQIWIKDFCQHFITLHLTPKVKLNGIMASDSEL